MLKLEARVESAWFKPERLTLTYDKLLSSYAFNFKLCHYGKVEIHHHGRRVPWAVGRRTAARRAQRGRGEDHAVNCGALC